MKGFIINLLAASLEEVGEELVGEGLNELSAIETDEDLILDIKGTYNTFKRMQNLAGKTKTKIDNAIADAIVGGCEAWAKANGIDLSKK